MKNIEGQYGNESDSTQTINEDNVDDVLAELVSDDPPKVSWKEAGKGLRAMIDRLRETNGGQNHDNQGI